MKLTIDTEQKIVTIDEDVNLKELYDHLQKHYKNEWKDYKLVKEVKYIEKDRFIPSQPYTYPPIIGGDKYPITFSGFETTNFLEEIIEYKNQKQIEINN